MKSWIPILLSIACLQGVVLAGPPRVVFSQEVSAFDERGNPYPARSIDPAKIPGMRRIEFSLGPNTNLAVETNLTDPTARGVAELAETVSRGLRYVERRTGVALAGDVLLYVIELEQIPLAYKFRAAFDSEVDWLEVRLALIESGQPLHGPEMAPALADLVFDTIPHELGHDVFRRLPGLLVDTDRAPSRHTRWFTEGVCEILAKGFAAAEAPRRLRVRLERSPAEGIVAEAWAESKLFGWAQENANSYRLESDLYRSSLMVAAAALERIELADLLDILSTQTDLDGPALLDMIEAATGLDSAALLARGRQLARLQRFRGWRRMEIALGGFR